MERGQVPNRRTGKLKRLNPSLQMGGGVQHLSKQKKKGRMRTLAIKNNEQTSHWFLTRMQAPECDVLK